MRLLTLTFTFECLDFEVDRELLEFYLDSLTNWNEAMVYSYEVGKKYTTGVLLKEWKEVIEVVREDSDSAAGQ